MTEYVNKNELMVLKVPFEKAKIVNGRVYADFQHLFERIDMLPTTSESKIKEQVINEILNKIDRINLWDDRDKDVFRLVLEGMKSTFARQEHLTTDEPERE